MLIRLLRMVLVYRQTVAILLLLRKGRHIRLEVHFLGTLGVEGFVELLVGVHLHLLLVLIVNLHVVLLPVNYLQKQHPVVVDHVQEQHYVDDQGQQVLGGRPGVALVYFG